MLGIVLVPLSRYLIILWALGSLEYYKGDQFLAARSTYKFLGNYASMSYLWGYVDPSIKAGNY